MPFCDCQTDGYCPRYNRTMAGRMRELCQGVNVDLGTAAAFREQWAREAGPVKYKESAEKILLKTDQCVGDAVAMTAAIYSLHKSHPGQFLTAVESPWPEVFQYNPDVVHVDPDQWFKVLGMHYPAIHKSNERGIHFMQGWCEHLGASLGIQVPLLTNRPHLYFNTPTPEAADFWLICTGGKNDFTNKLWGYWQYQELVHRLEGKINFMQVGKVEDNYRWLRGTMDSRGTTLRELFDLVRRVRGVVCGVSLLMHVAAALEKPAIVIAGGREPVTWNCYPKQQYLHTVGALPCTIHQGEVGGCWRSRVVPLGDGSLYDRDTCERPVGLGSYVTPECMALISPADVAAQIIRYNNQYEHSTHCQ